jgi:hypothetical protein
MSAQKFEKKKKKFLKILILKKKFQIISKMFQIFFFPFSFTKVILFERKIKTWENFDISPPKEKKTIQFVHQSHQGRDYGIQN